MLLRADRVEAITSITTIALDQEVYRLMILWYCADGLTDLWCYGGKSALPLSKVFYDLTLVLLDI